MVSPLSSRLLGLHNSDGSPPSQIPLAQLQKLPHGTKASAGATAASAPSNNIARVAPTGMSFQFVPTFQPPAFNAASLQPVQPQPQPQLGPRPTTSTNTNTNINIKPKAGIRRHTATRYVPILPATSRNCPTRPRVSGYSADQESSSSSSSGNSNPFSSDGGVGNNLIKSKRALEVAALSKKRKLEEMNYAAKTVKEDLERGGKSYEYVLKGRARALPAGSVDMSKVQLVTAAEYDAQCASQAAKDTTSTANVTSTANGTTASSANVYNALLDATRYFYNCTSGSHRDAIIDDPSLGPTSSNDLVSSLANIATTAGRGLRSGTSTCTPSTSSDTESDGSVGVVDIAPCLEDGLMSDEEVAALCPSPPAVDDERNKIAATTLEMALSYSPKARLIVRSIEPYQIVHANAAYFQLSGLQSTNLVGQSVSTILEGPAGGKGLTSFLSPSANPIDLQPVIIKGEEERDESASLPMPETACRVSVSPVTDASKITHYLVELDASDKTNEQIIDGSMQKRAADTFDGGYSVIG